MAVWGATIASEIIRARTNSDNAGRRMPALLAAMILIGLSGASPANAENGKASLPPIDIGQAAADVGTTALKIAQSANETPAGKTVRFDIPSQPLSSALTLFGRQSGLQIAVGSDLVAGLRTAGLKGVYTPEQALRALLAGTDLQYSFTSPKTVTLAKTGAQNVGDALQLSPITVEGVTESPYGPDKGFVANRSVAGTKTDTPIIETPQSITVITRDQMNARAVQNIGDAVQYSAGVRANQQTESSGLGGSNIVIRGFGGDGTSGNSFNEYIDGLRIRGTNFASAGFESYLFERVEVLKGPSSVLYGQSTPAGVVNHVSKRPTTERFLEIQGEAGSFDRFEGAFDFGGAVDENGRLSFRLTGLALDTDAQTDFTGRERKVIAPAVTVRPSKDTSFTLLATYQDDDFEGGFVNRVPAAGTIFSNPNGEIPDDFFQGDPNFNSWDRQLFSIGYQLEHRFNRAWAVRQNFRYAHNELDLKTIFGTLQADLRTLNRSSFTADEQADDVTLDNQVEARFETAGIGHTVLFGLDYQRLRRDTVRTLGTVAPLDIFNPVYGVTIPALSPFQDIEIREDQIGLYAQNQIKIDNWIVTVGGRYDLADSETRNRRANTKSEQSDREFSGRAGIGYLFDNGLAPYFSYAESFEPVADVDFSGNPFKPTTGKQLEGGIKYQPPGYNALVTASAFHLTQQNVTTADPNNPGFDIQTGEVRSRGFELEGAASFEFGLNLTASYTFLDAVRTKTNDNTIGNKPAGTAEHWASFWGDYTIPDGPLAGLGAGLGVRYIGASAGDAQNSFEVPSYTLVDAAIRYDLGGITPHLGSSQVAVNVSNLLDKTYVASCARIDRCFQGVGRNVIGTVKLRW